MAKCTVGKHWTSLLSRKTQVGVARRHHYTFTGMAKMHRGTVPSVIEDAKCLERPNIAEGGVQWHSP